MVCHDKPDCEISSKYTVKTFHQQAAVNKGLDIRKYYSRHVWARVL